MSKKSKPKKAVKVKATRAEYEASGYACAMLALWACDAFSLPQTAENARALYRLAWSRADEHMQAKAFVADPFDK